LDLKYKTVKSFLEPSEIYNEISQLSIEKSKRPG